MASTAADGWATVTTKKAQVAPHLRQKEVAVTASKTPEVMDVNNAALFPSLGKKQSVATPTTKLNFKQKVDDLIALDKRTEAEREAAEEASRAMEGFVSLSMRIDKAFLNNMMKRDLAAAKRQAEEEMCGVGIYSNCYGQQDYEEDEESISDEE